LLAEALEEDREAEVVEVGSDNNSTSSTYASTVGVPCFNWGGPDNMGTE